MKLSNLLLGLTGCFFATSLSGCFVVTSDTPAPAADTGAITIALSLDGNASTSECDYFHVDGLHVEIFDGGGTVIEADSDCYDLGMTIDNLSPGRYTVNASLLKGRTVVSDVIAVEDTPVSRNVESIVKIDFPAKWIH
jgi:hypothetical protein